MKGLVLAGGKSTRFGSDKALATFKGRLFIEIAFSQISYISREVCISLSHRSSQEVIKTAKRLTDCIVFDQQLPCQGPIRGVLTGLETLKDDIIYVTVDHPYLRPETIAEFHRQIQAYNPFSATIISSRDTSSHSIGYLSKHIVDQVHKICKAKERTRLIDVYRLQNSLFIGWSLLTNDPIEFTNVNVPGFQPRESIDKVNDIVYINHNYFISFIHKLVNGYRLEALALLLQEKQLYSRLDLKFLLKYVYRDIEYMLSKLNL